MWIVNTHFTALPFHPLFVDYTHKLLSRPFPTRILDLPMDETSPTSVGGPQREQEGSRRGPPSDWSHGIGPYLQLGSPAMFPRSPSLGIGNSAEGTTSTHNPFGGWRRREEGGRIHSEWQEMAMECLSHPKSGGERVRQGYYLAHTPSSIDKITNAAVIGLMGAVSTLKNRSL